MQLKNTKHSHSATYKTALPPEDHLGARYVQWFNDGWKLIAETFPKPGNKQEWITQNPQYGVDRRSLWKRHPNPAELIDISFANATNYVMFDIDIVSYIHAFNASVKVCKFLQTLKKIGLIHPVGVQSSWSEGLNIYYFFSEQVGTFDAACTIMGTLIDEKFRVTGGQLERSPNCKPYGFREITDYRQHRVPLQPHSGAHLMKIFSGVAADDWEKDPEEFADVLALGIDEDNEEQYRQELARFLDEADRSAAANDLKLFRAAMTKQYKNRKKLVEGKGMSAAALAWKLDLEIITNEGWTGYGQTNDLLRYMAVYGVVFLGLEGEELAADVKETAIAGPGYKQWCRHQHEIEKRATEWAKEVQKDGYYLKYRNFPKRLQTSYQKFRHVLNNVFKHTRANPTNSFQATAAHARIWTVVTSLKDHNIYPDTIQGTAEVITVRAGVSPQTLYKDSNLPLRHPRLD